MMSLVQTSISSTSTANHRNYVKCCCEVFHFSFSLEYQWLVCFLGFELDELQVPNQRRQTKFATKSVQLIIPRLRASLQILHAKQKLNELDILVILSFFPSKHFVLPMEKKHKEVGV